MSIESVANARALKENILTSAKIANFRTAHVT